MIQADDLISVGKLLKPHALKGELNAELDIDPDFFLEDYPVIVELDGIYVPFYVKSFRKKGMMTGYIMLDTIDAEEEARKLVNKQMFGLKKDVAEFLDVEEDELLTDFDSYIGYEGETTDNIKLGKLVDIDDSTSNVLFVFEKEGGDRILIPHCDEFLIEVDNEKKILVFNLPEGLVELNEKKEK